MDDNELNKQEEMIEKPKALGDHTEDFLEVLEKRSIRTVFQPIISLRDGSVLGYEALSRGPEDSLMYSPVALFDYAEKENKLWELEYLCRIKAIEAVCALNKRFKLFLNVNPRVIHDKKFKQGFTREYLDQYRISPEDIIFEITEKSIVNNTSEFIRTVDHYKEQFYKIAVDDAGAGYSGLNLISDIHPHYIKLDMKLIRDIHKDPTKQALLKSFLEFANVTNTHLVAGGIETRQELLKLIEIGVHYGQGYFIRKPDSLPSGPDRDIIDLIRDANTKKNQIMERSVSGLYIGNISTNQRTLSRNILTLQVYEMMEDDRSISALIVAEEGKPIGTLTRSELYRNLSGHYGFTLYAKKPVERIMEKDFLVVDYRESIEMVSKKAMNRDYDKLYDLITVTRDGKYYGVVTVKDLLEKTLQIEVNHAKHINPLSELPGNLMIEHKLEECIRYPEGKSILYFDLDNFKAYNDVYGFENGDRFIKGFAGLLKKKIKKDSDFIGHIGGDDFVAVVSQEDAEGLCCCIIEEFEQLKCDYYNKNDLDKGYITTKNRHGIEEDFPLLSVSIGGVSANRHDTIYQMSENISLLKRICKQKPGSNYILEREA